MTLERWSDLQTWLASEEASDWWAEVAAFNSLAGNPDAAADLLEAFGISVNASTRARLDALISEFVA